MKLRHLSGVYKLMPEAPTVEDLMYWLKISKKKAFSTADVEKTFPNRPENIARSLKKLVESGDLLVQEDTYKLP